MVKPRKNGDDVKSEKVRPVAAEREDLDDESFDLEKYEREFDLIEELDAPALEDEDFEVKHAAAKATKPKKGKSKSRSTITADEVLASAQEEEQVKEVAKEKKSEAHEIKIEDSPSPVDDSGAVSIAGSEDSSEEGSGIWVAFLVILILIASGIAYNYAATQMPESADACMKNYLTATGGKVLEYNTLSPVAKVWVDTALRTQNPENAKEILQMVACQGSNLKADTQVEEVNCPPAKVTLVLSERAMSNALGATVSFPCSDSSQNVFCGGASLDVSNLKVEGAKVDKVIFVNGLETKKQVTGEDADQSLIIFKNPGQNRYRSLYVSKGEEGKIAVRLFAGDTKVEGMKLKYVTDEPRYVAWEIA